VKYDLEEEEREPGSIEVCVLGEGRDESTRNTFSEAEASCINSRIQAFISYYIHSKKKWRNNFFLKSNGVEFDQPYIINISIYGEEIVLYSHSRMWVFPSLSILL
jgi:hypothetical protein